ncbi:peptide deformylase [Candidatus Saccharibacteria bacterium]|nr:peptide deformylase [Candidatus Saccharibacteria bacterium]
MIVIMGLLDSLITLPDVRLRKPSKDVAFDDAHVKLLADKMKNVVLEWEKTRQYEIGAALSAIQIAEPYRVVVVREDFSDKDNQSFVTLLNPRVVASGGGVESDYEGCLSIVDVYGIVPRNYRVTVAATNLEGKEITIQAEGFLARVLQHEIDHTNGVMFIDHIKDHDAFYALEPNGDFKKIPHKDVLESSALWATQ